MRPLDVTKSLPQGNLVDLRESALQSSALASSPDANALRPDAGARPRQIAPALVLFLWRCSSALP